MLHDDAHGLYVKRSVDYGSRNCDWLGGFVIGYYVDDGRYGV